MIAGDGVLRCDRAMSQRDGHGTRIGMANIKARRLRLPVPCHPGTFVGDYVPFCFCPRSVMLYLLHRGNHPELPYRGGEGRIVHLEAGLNQAVAWAERTGRRWAVCLSNAAAYDAQDLFRTGLNHLDEIDWTAVASNDFRQEDVRRRKQAEFLLHDSFAWSLVSRIGVLSRQIAGQAAQALADAEHRPAVQVMPNWYFGT